MGTRGCVGELNLDGRLALGGGAEGFGAEDGHAEGDGLADATEKKRKKEN